MMICVPCFNNEVNREIRREYQNKNRYIFLTSTATPIKDTVSPSNLIAKNLWKYSKRYGLKTFNAHSIRRLYAQNLINRGANINLFHTLLVMIVFIQQVNICI